MLKVNQLKFNLVIFSSRAVYDALKSNRHVDLTGSLNWIWYEKLAINFGRDSLRTWKIDLKKIEKLEWYFITDTVVLFLSVIFNFVPTHATLWCTKTFTHKRQISGSRGNKRIKNKNSSTNETSPLKVFNESRAIDQSKSIKPISLKTKGFLFSDHGGWRPDERASPLSVSTRDTNTDSCISNNSLGLLFTHYFCSVSLNVVISSENEPAEMIWAHVVEWVQIKSSI